MNSYNNYENKPVQRLIDAYRDIWGYDESSKLIERLNQDNNQDIEDVWWFAIK